MKTFLASSSSREDLQRKLVKFLEQNPSAVFNEESLFRAHSLAVRLDNMSEGGIVDFEIKYTHQPD